jgi:anti-anti-sigma regulatory factor
MKNDSSDFGAVTYSDGGNPIVALWGTAKDDSAFDLAAILDAAIDRKPASMVLDLAELEFAGKAALLAISDAEKRLAAMGVTLTLRAPSALVNRLMRIMEFAATPRLEGALPRHHHLGPEQLDDRSAQFRRVASSLSMDDPHRVTALPTHRDVVDDVLRLIVELARISIESADGVSISLRRNGVLSTVAASDETIMAMDLDQYSTGEGPCVDASITGHWFHAESLDTETRWPAFTPQARGLGIKAILSSPLRVFEMPVGALNIYSRSAKSFELKDQESAAVFAQQASVILCDAGAERE